MSTVTGSPIDGHDLAVRLATDVLERGGDAIDGAERDRLGGR